MPFAASIVFRAPGINPSGVPRCEPLYVPPVQAEILDEVGAIDIAYIINKFPWPLLSSSTKCRGSNTH